MRLLEKVCYHKVLLSHESHGTKGFELVTHGTLIGGLPPVGKLYH